MTWPLIFGLPEIDRRIELRRFFESLPLLLEEVRQEQLRDLAAYENALSQNMLVFVTGSRLRAWLEMDFEDACAVARSYERVVGMMPLARVISRAQAVQSVAAHMPADEVELLRMLVPSLNSSMPQAPADGPSPIQPSVGPAAAQRQPQREQPRPWWAFWKRAA
jgi:hypothetical protein